MADSFKFSIIKGKLNDSAAPAANSSLLLPSAVQNFLPQLFDSQDGSASSGNAQNKEQNYDYAAQVILPLTRWPESEFLSRLNAELSRTSNLMVLERELQKQKDGKFGSFIISLQNIEGKPVYLNVATREFRLQGARRVVATLSEHATDGASLNDYNRLLNIIDYMPGYVALIDKDHRVVFENRAFCHYFGTPQGRTCHEVMRQSSEPCTGCRPFEALETGVLCVSDWTARDGRCAFRVYSYPFEEADGNKLLLKVGLDITAGLRTQEALNQSEERYRTIADNLSQGIAVMGKNLLIGASNTRLQEWFDDAAMRGKPFYALFPEEEPLSNPAHSDSILKLTFEDGQRHETEIDLEIHGERRNFRLSCYPVFTARRQVRAIIAMLEDVTERNLVALRLGRAKRLEAMGNLAAGIAHEINQPLSAVHLYAAGLEMLLEKNEHVPLETLKERLGFILREAKKIKDIIAHMRALALQDVCPELTFVSLEETLAEALTLLGAQLGSHGINLFNELSENLPRVKANKVQLEQVLVNLLVNAMHALDNQTEQEAANGNFSEKHIIVRAKLLEDKRLALRIIDNGPGFSGIEDKIFDPFFRSADSHKNNGQGMGLGLSIVHTFVQSWKGEITAHSLTDGEHGALFQIILDTELSKAGESARTVAAIQEATAEPAGNSRVLKTKKAAAPGITLNVTPVVRQK